MFSTIELFAGAGGLALGIEKAGFNTLACLEFDKDACDTLRKNRPQWRVIEDDIANISCLDLENYFSLKKGELALSSIFLRREEIRLGRCTRDTFLSLCNFLGETPAENVLIRECTRSSHA